MRLFPKVRYYREDQVSIHFNLLCTIFWELTLAKSDKIYTFDGVNPIAFLSFPGTWLLFFKTFLLNFNFYLNKACYALV